MRAVDLGFESSQNCCQHVVDLDGAASLMMQCLHHCSLCLCLGLPLPPLELVVDLNLALFERMIQKKRLLFDTGLAHFEKCAGEVWYYLRQALLAVVAGPDRIRRGHRCVLHLHASCYIGVLKTVINLIAWLDSDGE